MCNIIVPLRQKQLKDLDEKFSLIGIAVLIVSIQLFAGGI